MSDQQYDLITTANAHYAAGQFEEAYQAFLAAAALNQPGDVTHFDSAGHCLANLARFEEATKLYTVFVAQNPDSAGVLGNLAKIYFELGNYSLATHYADELVRIFGNTEDYLVLQFSCRLFAEDYSAAGDVLDIYFELYRTEHVYYTKIFEVINANASLERRAKGMEVFHARGKHIMIVIILMMSYLRSIGQMTRAISVMDNYLKSKVRILQNEFIISNVYRAQYALTANDVPGAIRRLQRSIERVRSVKLAGGLLFTLGYAHALDGSPDLALDCYRAAVSGLPSGSAFKVMRTTVQV
jgi:tetratricopeptide (TPR) repeat protein